MTFARKRNPSPPVERAQGDAQAGADQPGFEQSFQLYWTRICGVLTRMLGDAAEAEDLTLDVFYRLYSNPPAMETNLGGWLYRTATNLGLNALRARGRRQRYEEDAGAWALNSRQEWDPAVELEKSQERQRVRQILAQMKPRSAQLLLLRHSGFSYQEIAEALGIAPGTVGKLLERAEKDFEDRFTRDDRSAQIGQEGTR